MRMHGEVVEWRDDRGFGFIEVSGSRERVFVHVSAFGQAQVRPAVGELVSFELELDDKGRRRAVRVMRPRAARSGAHSAPARRDTPPSSIWLLLGLLAIGLMIAAVFHMLARPIASAAFDPAHARGRLSGERALTGDTPQGLPNASAGGAGFKCDGRRFCSEMQSCAEAEFFLSNCPGTEMDGDGDGVPCEQQHCGH